MFFMTKPVVLHITKFRGVHIDSQLDRKDRYEDNVYLFKINPISYNQPFFIYTPLLSIW